MDRRLRLFLIALLLLPAASLLASTDVSITLSAPKFAPIGGSTFVQVNVTATGGSATDAKADPAFRPRACCAADPSAAPPTVRPALGPRRRVAAVGQKIGWRRAAP